MHKHSCACCPPLPPHTHQVLYIDHAKAQSCEESILEVNAVPAAHSKGLLQQPHPGNTPAQTQLLCPMAVDAAAPAAQQQQASGGSGGEGSDLSDDEVAEAGARSGGDTGARARGGDAGAADAVQCKL
jgi:hypothetical protein